MSLLLALTGGGEPVIYTATAGAGRFALTNIVQKQYRYRYKAQEAIEALEPGIAAVIEAKAHQGNHEAIKTTLDRFGYAYHAKYEALYSELIREIEQQKEDEHIMALIAELL